MKFLVLPDFNGIYDQNKARFDLGFRIGVDSGYEKNGSIISQVVPGMRQPIDIFLTNLVFVKKQHALHCCGLLTLEGFKWPYLDERGLPDFIDVLKETLLLKVEDTEERMYPKGMYMMAAVAEPQTVFADVCKSLGLAKIDSFKNPNSMNNVTLYGGQIE